MGPLKYFAELLDFKSSPIHQTVFIFLAAKYPNTRKRPPSYLLRMDEDLTIIISESMEMMTQSDVTRP